jgi:protein-S-isoprenylcysteine O-methyltransferase Ste14
MIMITALNGGNANGGLSEVQRRRKWALLSAIAIGLLFFLFSASAWRHHHPIFYELIEWSGMILILICVVGRTWCSLYIGGRKKSQLVVTGPYSIVRNPLYVFTLIGSVGVGWQMGSLVMGAVCAIITYFVFRAVIEHEENFLRSAFPDAFTAYAARVPRLWPQITLWTDARIIVVLPKPVVRTFADTCVLLLAVPIAEVIDALHAAEVLPVLLKLP